MQVHAWSKRVQSYTKLMRAPQPQYTISIIDLSTNSIGRYPGTLCQLWSTLSPRRSRSGTLVMTSSQDVFFLWNKPNCKYYIITMNAIYGNPITKSSNGLSQKYLVVSLGLTNMLIRCMLTSDCLCLFPIFQNVINPRNDGPIYLIWKYHILHILEHPHTVCLTVPTATLALGHARHEHAQSWLHS